MSTVLRDWQAEAVERVRDAVRDGHKNILVVAPTGAGKTILATHIIAQADAKCRRSAFVVDRISLINQTSSTFAANNLSHGVIQADHPLWAPHRRIQVCSQQTLARRQWPDAELIVVDEAHTVTETVRKRISPRDTITLGLTATPFTKGLGKLYDTVVNVTTTNKLIADGILAPFRIFAAVEPNMDGVRVVAGEFDEQETSKRALEVVGDVVAEYLKHGEGRKFICSAVDTAHVEELQRQFMQAGVQCATYTYKDRDEDRAETVAEFRKPDSYIRGLITVTAASKGFDVPDIGCVIMARPLRKSLAEHIQFFGRGLRACEGKKDCLSRGTLVLTDRGEVPIEHITIDHKVWDGEQFVSHAGAVCRGVREVIEYDGLIATPDHRVMTDDGWTRFEDAARGRRRIARTGIDGHTVRLVDDLLAHRAGQREQSSRRGRVRSMWGAALRAISQYPQAAKHGRLSALQWSAAGAGSEMAVRALPGPTEQMHQPERFIVLALRWARNRVSVFFGERGGALGCGESRRSGSIDATGSSRQQRALRAGKFALDDAGRKPEQHSRLWWEGALHRLSQSLSWRQVCGRDAGEIARDDGARGDRRALETALVQTEREVWDVLNAGPLQRFTANGRLVHNCLVLDHSGNSARFWDEWTEFFETGAVELDDGKRKAKPKKPENAEDKLVKCPQCRLLHKPMPFCPSCGHEYPKRQSVQHVPGTLKELMGCGNRDLQRRQLWPQVVAYVLEQTDDMERAQKRAQGVFRELTGDFAKARVETTTPEAPSLELRRKIKANTIRWAKGRQKAEQEARA